MSEDEGGRALHAKNKNYFRKENCQRIRVFEAGKVK